MEFKIITDVENKLFNRREIQGEIHSDVSPKREEVLALIAGKVKTAEEKIKIKTIQPKFGQRVFLIVANIYGSEKSKGLVEKKSKKEKALEEKRKKIEEEAKASSDGEAIPEQQNPDEVVTENNVEE